MALVLLSVMWDKSQEHDRSMNRNEMPGDDFTVLHKILTNKELFSSHEKDMIATLEYY
jgi:hypothetical protein